jgi:sulfur carrier protein
MSQITTDAVTTITVNGESQPYQSQSIRELLIARGLDPDKQGIAVAVNARVVHRADWNTTAIEPDNRIDIVRATAGG